MKTVIVTTGLFCLIVGMAVFWSNPRRFTGQVFAVVSLLVACWQWAVAGAMHFWSESPMLAMLCMRANGMIAVLLAWSTWWLHQSIVCGEDGRRQTLQRALPLLIFVVPCLVLCTQSSYVGTYGAARGWAYYVFVGCGLVWHSWALLRTAREMQTQVGMRRVEIQFLSINLSLTFLLVIAASGFGNWLHLDWLRRTSFFIFLAGYFLAAWAMTFHRVFDARQIFTSLGQRLATLVTLAVSVTAWSHFFDAALPQNWNFLLGLSLCGAAGFWLDAKSRQWLRLGSERKLAAMRGAIIGIARTEPDPDLLVAEFEKLLRQYFHSETAKLISDQTEVSDGWSGKLPNRVAMTTLCELDWITPESVERRRPTEGLCELRQFLADHALSLLVAAPRGSPTPTLLVALGAKADGWPYTYHDIQCLQAVAELMDNILARSRLTAQAALRAKMDHVTMMSRGLAHDLKNLITPISAYLVHTKGRNEPGSAEEEVHAAARRSVNVMTDYIRQAAFFASELTPHWQNVSLSKVCDAVHEQTSSLAARRGVTLQIEVDDLFLVADAVLLQRLLANLVNNAIDATRAGDRIVLRGNLGRPEWVRLKVIDEGCGIPAENLSRIFEPYFTTKEFGEEVRGFGLGLSICQKIVQLHGGVMSVKSEVGQGTTFTIELPQRASAPGAAPSPQSIAIPPSPSSQLLVTRRSLDVR